MKFIKIADPTFNNSEKKIIFDEFNNILNSKLSMGNNVLCFEKEFTKYINRKYAIGFNSCTSALEAVLQAINIKNCEVIIPSQSFIATAMSVHLSGGKVIFAEISKKNNFSLSYESIKKKITKKTKAVVIVHINGFISNDILKIKKLCKKNKIYLIEDAAHTPGASYKGKKAGEFGDAACFSFYPTKIITTGEGGMLVTNNKKLHDYARSYQLRGRDIKSLNEVYINPGRNVRLQEISALLGRIQLKKIKKIINKRKIIAKTYFNKLSKIKEISLPTLNLDNSPSYWKFHIFVQSSIRHKLIKMFKKNYIEVDIAYDPPLHLQPVIKKIYRTKKNHLPETEQLLKTHINLPCHQNLTQNDVSRIINVINKFFKIN